MQRVGLLTVLALTGGWAPLHGQATDYQSFGDRVARIISPSIRRADRRLEEIHRRIDSLPSLYDGPRGSRYGFHSETILSETEPQWLQVDLEKSSPIDSIVVIPVHLPLSGLAGEGYGFPRRFKIEISESSDPLDFKLVVDHTAADFENPGRYPLKFATPGAKGRYVRMTSTKHLPGENGFSWALEEFMVLSGSYNIAAARPRSANSHEDLFPNWSIGRVNDGLSRLGYPWDHEPSPTKGFLSAPSMSAHAGKWIVVDFGEPHPIDEVHLVPTDSDDKEVVGGRGFPNHFLLELSEDRDFKNKVWQSEHSKMPLGYPWNSAFVRHCPGKPARYLRVTAKELFARGDKHSFALAEIQAFSRGKNIALGQPVFVSDRTEHPVSSGWAPEFVVDGYSSSHRLTELPEFVDRIIERGELERERDALRLEREGKIEITSAGVTAGIGSMGGVAIFGWIWMIVRQRSVRRRDAELLREQIARDLHDDIGSNLGGIVLLSEVGSMHAQANPEIQKDFAEIKETAENTSEAMRDIVWLIHAGKGDLRDLIIKMRECVETILGDMYTIIETEPVDFRNRSVGLLMRRHFFFAFKESLNNVRKHARATRADIRIIVGTNRVTFEIADNGVGFDLDSASQSGHGLENLKRRAGRVNGSCTIESKPGGGTTVSFSAPMKG